MAIRDDLPVIEKYLDEIEWLLEAAANMDVINSLNQINAKEGEAFEQFQLISRNRDLCNEAVNAHHLRDEVVKEFIKDVENSLAESYSPVEIGFGYIWLQNPTQNWYNRRILNQGSVIDEHISFMCFHPRLIEIATNKWNGNIRVTLGEKKSQDPRKYYSDITVASEKYGLPSDMSSRDWTHDCLYLIEASLKKLNISYKLSDFVEWACTGEPPNLSQFDEFGLPTHVLEAPFGSRLEPENGITRIEGTKIWKLPNGSYVSPLWEYLSWSAEKYGDLCELARRVACIGEGIDAAVTYSDPKFDTHDKNRLRTTPQLIFAAGEASAFLKVKFELEESVLAGRKEKITAAKRIKASGEKSREARNKRRKDLFEKIEMLAARSPDIVKFGEDAVAKLALHECIQESRSAWKQGAGQITDYLGEIRRGEAGKEMQNRYLALFQQKPPKRL